MAALQGLTAALRQRAKRVAPCRGDAQQSLQARLHLRVALAWEGLQDLGESEEAHAARLTCLSYCLGAHGLELLEKHVQMSDPGLAAGPAAAVAVPALPVHQVCCQFDPEGDHEGHVHWLRAVWDSLPVPEAM